MKFIIAAAAILSIFGLATITAPAQALPALPSQCPGVISDYNVIDKGTLNAVVNGTDGKDFIRVRWGLVDGKGGDDCIVFTDTVSNGIAFGGPGDDVIISSVSSWRSRSGQAYGDYQHPTIVSETYLPPGCDPEQGDENASDYCTDYVVVYAPEGTSDRCIGRWAIRHGCEFTN